MSETEMERKAKRTTTRKQNTSTAKRMRNEEKKLRHRIGSMRRRRRCRRIAGALTGSVSIRIFYILVFASQNF